MKSAATPGQREIQTHKWNSGAGCTFTNRTQCVQMHADETNAEGTQIDAMQPINAEAFGHQPRSIEQRRDCNVVSGYPCHELCVAKPLRTHSAVQCE